MHNFCENGMYTDLGMYLADRIIQRDTFKPVKNISITSNSKNSVRRIIPYFWVIPLFYS